VSPWNSLTLKTKQKSEVPLYTNKYVQSSSRKNSGAFGLQHLEFLKPHTYLTGLSKIVKLDQFIQSENVGTELNVKCGAYTSGKCPVVGHTFSFAGYGNMLNIFKKIVLKTYCDRKN